MFTRYCYKNSIKSKRTYLSDYSIDYETNPQIDMSLSGKFLIERPQFNINDIQYDKYYLPKDIKNLEKLIKNKYHLEKEVIITPGSNGALQNIIKILFANKKGKKNLVTPFYTFDQAEYTVTSFGGYTKRVFCDKYKINLDKIKKTVDSKTQLIYLCNPNNPTGLFIKPKDIIEFANKCNKIIIVDESAIEFTKYKSMLDYNNIPDNIIVLRTFSKAYGLASLRIGFIVCSKSFKDLYIKNITQNEVSGLSCKITEEILKYNEKDIKSNVNLIIKERENIINSLEKINIKCLKSKSNLIMTKNTFDKQFLKTLKDEGVKVVHIKDENNNIHLRIAIQDKKTNKQFINKIKRITNNLKGV